ncbi:unnamed protein product [Pedinophyceae sp. YPF-701]|nr:unnamed protein product [Pedinophyceae sp. YPF-701]
MQEDGAQQDALRADGRSDRQIRSMVCERGVLERADGSARWTQGGTSVLAAVHGPLVRGGPREDPERMTVEVTILPRSGLPTSRDRHNETVVRATVESAVLLNAHPRCCVTVALQVAADDGAVLACALNAASAALVDAGVPMRHPFACVTVAVAPTGRLLVDPDSDEEKAAGALAHIAHVGKKDQGEDKGPVSGAMITCDSYGKFTLEQFAAAAALAAKGCAHVTAFARESLNGLYVV